MGGAGPVKINLYDDSSLYIGSNVCMNSNTIILCRKKIHIGDDTMFGPNVVIIDHDHDYKNRLWKDTFKCDDIFIGNNVWIGANVTILKGSYIEDHSVIGAGVVVKGLYRSDTVSYNQQHIVVKPYMRKDIE